jgi:hypothetical protein
VIVATPVVIAATVAAGGCCTGAARVVRVLGLVTRASHVFARLTQAVTQCAGVFPAELGLLGLVPTPVSVVEPIVGRGRSGRVVGGSAAGRAAAVVVATADACGEREAGDGERHCGRPNRELDHRRSFPSLHRDEGCRDAVQARAKAG